MAFRVLILGSVSEEVRRDLSLLEDGVEILVPPEGRMAEPSIVARLRPHLLVLGTGAPFTGAALYGAAAGPGDPVPSISLEPDPSADLVLPADGSGREEALRLARRLGNLRAALDGPPGNRIPVALRGPGPLRDSFGERLVYEFSRAVRYRHPVALVTLSVDGRDGLIGTYGPAAVEEFHGVLADALRRCLRDVDLLYRASDDEIAAILPETTAAGARIPADRFLTQTSRLIFKPTVVTDRPMLPLKATSSIGVADGPRAGVSSAEDLLSRARESLGSARVAGGARIFVHGAPAESVPPSLG
jgi:diguanylate cyclase (GGDEF)-like protein